ncbi:MAG: hypothetical protein K2J17_06420 [Paramuribaculum sp.]|nr:hypothetical protein [Paramuribaculum sp.]
MKKFFICLVISLTSSLTSQAVETGYRGFFEYGYLIGVDDQHRSSMNEIITVHGWQMTPRIFLGAGVNLNLYKFKFYDDKIHYNLPLFADIRYDFLDSSISPFLDFKMGYSVAGVFHGPYYNPSIGCRLALGDSCGLNFGIGYTYFHTRYKFIVDGSDFNITGVNLRVGVDF